MFSHYLFENKKYLPDIHGELEKGMDRSPAVKASPANLQASETPEWLFCTFNPMTVRWAAGVCPRRWCMWKVNDADLLPEREREHPEASQTHMCFLKKMRTSLLQYLNIRVSEPGRTYSEFRLVRVSRFHQLIVILDNQAFSPCRVFCYKTPKTLTAQELIPVLVEFIVYFPPVRRF